MNEMEPPISLLQKRKQQLIARFLKGDEPFFLERHTEILDDYFCESFARSSVGPQMRVDKKPYAIIALGSYCLLYTSPSPRDRTRSRMPSSA